MKWLFKRPEPRDGRFLLFCQDWDERTPVALPGAQHLPAPAYELAIERQREEQARLEATRPKPRFSVVK